ncbi:MAG: anti-sigma factor, partial [Anaerolineae bacterium]|nr:anti-sigma factor [Anaerolineae bacterium]
MDERDLELLSAYLDGRMNKDEQQALETRLAQDALLQRELDTLRETSYLLRALPELKSPRNLTIPASIQQKRTPLVLSPWVSTLSAVAAAFMLIAGFVLLNRTGTFQTG